MFLLDVFFFFYHVHISICTMLILFHWCQLNQLLLFIHLVSILLFWIYYIQHYMLYTITTESRVLAQIFLYTFESLFPCRPALERNIIGVKILLIQRVKEILNAKFLSTSGWRIVLSPFLRGHWIFEKITGTLHQITKPKVQRAWLCHKCQRKYQTHRNNLLCLHNLT